MGAQDFLTTYGPWSSETFSHCFAGQSVIVVILQVRKTEMGTNESVGDTINTLWHSTLSWFAAVHGHRLSWGELVFFVQSPDLAKTVAAMTTLSKSPLQNDCDVWFAVAEAPIAAKLRLETIADLSWRLHKVEYRQEYPNAWCGKNGVLTHRPDSTSLEADA